MDLCKPHHFIMLEEIIQYATHLNILEGMGLIFGLLCVFFLIRENILTWPCGIIYVLISFVIFWQARLYGDFLLHIFFLVLNIYGWIYWTTGAKRETANKVMITALGLKEQLFILSITAVGVFLFGIFLREAPMFIEGMAPASLPFWDSTTSVLSITGMWLTARKKIDNWYYWLVVDILATGIYYYKELYFYSLLYFIYIGLAIAGYVAWNRSMKTSTVDV